MDLPLSLVVPKDASVLSVIISILHKLDGSSASTQLDSSGFELRMVRAPRLPCHIMYSRSSLLILSDGFVHLLVVSPTIS